MEITIDKEILDLMKEVILQQLKAQKKGGEITQEDKAKLNSKRKSLIEVLIESEKVENEKERNEIEREKVKIEQDKLKFEQDKFKTESDIEYEKLENERIKIKNEREADTERYKYDFYGKVLTGLFTLAGTVIGLIFLNKWTQWGFIQEEFGSIAGKTMSNVMRNWQIKRI